MWVASENQRTPMSDVNRYGDEYPPSRPGLKTVIGAIVVVLAGLGIAFWADISAYIAARL
jgi:hypothetical protein